MNTRFITRNTLARIHNFVLVLFLSLFLGDVSKAEIVELTITGHWSERDIKVTSKLDKLYNPADPRLDGKVFGVDSSAGSLTLQLIVDTEGSIFFPKGSRATYDGGQPNTLTRDFYGYREVRLVRDTYSFGNATWKSEGILVGLIGPDRKKAALWTDVDIRKGEPSRVFFRMFGKAEGLKADLFISSGSQESVRKQFLLWEYYGGEEIRSGSFTVLRK